MAVNYVLRDNAQDRAPPASGKPHPALLNRIIEQALWVAAPVFAALVLVGIVMRYSPIPYGDDWGEYVARPGLFSLNNAHRIVVSRLIMWVDWALGTKFLVMFAAAIAMRIAIYCRAFGSLGDARSAIESPGLGNRDRIAAQSIKDCAQA